MNTASESRINFIIVGASVSGLASAIALKQAGHNVLVLEKDRQLGGVGSVPSGSGCAMMPPNACKIFIDWGLEAELHAKSTHNAGMAVYKYDRDMFLGVNRWDPEMLQEARGGYRQIEHRELVRLLYDFAVRPSSGDAAPSLVTVVFGAEVVELDCNAASVTLRSGQVHKADGIIGADGVNGIIRRALMEEEGVTPDEAETLTGMSVYNASIPKAVAYENGLGFVCDFPHQTCWTISGRGLRTFTLGKNEDLALVLWTPDGAGDTPWTSAAQKKLTDVLGPHIDHVHKMAALAGTATCIQIKEHYELESWISESGRVLAIGDAAHPFAPGSMHAYSCSLEDGVFVGTLFSHTRSASRVPQFFRAFQEHRETRCSRIQVGEKDLRELLCLPEGPAREAIETALLASVNAGQENTFEGNLESLLDDFREVFSYDASDDAQEWWMSWGRYGNALGVTNGGERGSGF
ncbi:hypothetical protein FB45DRAFT_87460 [Roridomyces roridus]|uniref:FAD-binding domain-containing protein n=1 Tax=Roridomyces roridus TaxID=1738132 RepID=A0AAD7BLV5_9AGAR|nr:hypothetical protein FB45DRAFT_87460 [Roridomyces roridus]